MADEDLLANYPVVEELPVQWGEMDAFDHVNNAVYFRYFEGARIAYFRRVGMPESIGADVGPILASTSCRYRSPLRYPDRIRIGVRVTELQRDRFWMDYRVVSEAQERVAATGDCLVVTFDYGAGTKADVPEAWREAFRRLEGDALTER